MTREEEDRNQAPEPEETRDQEEGRADEEGEAAVQADAAEPDGEDVEAGEDRTAPGDTLEEQLAQAKSEAEDWQGRFMRLHAEWDTYRRRVDEQRAQERARAGENLVSSLLPVLDDFERSIAYAEGNGEAGLLDGVKQVHAKLVDVLVKGGVEIIDPAGQPFNALEHQAVATTDRPDVYEETVDQVYQKGYKMGIKVLRPAMVTVTAGGPARPAPEPDEEGGE